jgi:hypothetical protein
MHTSQWGGRLNAVFKMVVARRAHASVAARSPFREVATNVSLPAGLVHLVAAYMLLALSAGCSDRLTEPRKLAPADRASMLICDDAEASPECIANPDPTPPQPDVWYDPPMIVAERTEITAQDNFVRTWMQSREFSDTLGGVIINGDLTGQQYCETNGYLNRYNAQISGSCPTGPCYSQWKDMRNAGIAWAGMVNGLLLSGLAVRNAWGLFAITLPAATGAYLTWGKVDDARKKYIMCMSQDNNWSFYYLDPWNGSNPYTKPRYPNGMPR